MRTGRAFWYGSPMETTKTSFSFTTDPVVRRLRWVMLFAILVNLGLALVGQPSSYWQHPGTADERNHLFHYFMVRGLPIFACFELAYLVVALLVASLPCKRGALIFIFSYIFGHYCGACSWLSHDLNLGTAGIVVYGFVLSLLIVPLAFQSE
jgi:hypothetical protein